MRLQNERSLNTTHNTFVSPTKCYTLRIRKLLVKLFFIFFNFFLYLPSLWITLCWDCWKRYMNPTLDAALLCLNILLLRTYANVGYIYVNVVFMADSIQSQTEDNNLGALVAVVCSFRYMYYIWMFLIHINMFAKFLAEFAHAWRPLSLTFNIVFRSQCKHLRVK